MTDQPMFCIKDESPEKFRKNFSLITIDDYMPGLRELRNQKLDRAGLVQLINNAMFLLESAEN